jgi:hypothetical protein
MSDLMSAGGAMSTVILGLTGLGALLTLAFAGITLTKRRVPLVAWVLVPALVCTVGALAAWSTAGGVLTAIGSAEADAVVTTAWSGLFESMGIDYMSRWMASFLFIAATWGAAAGATIATGTEYRFTPFAAATSALLTLLGAGTMVWYASMSGAGGDTMLLVTVLAIGGLGVAFGAVRRAIYEESNRVAAMRFVASACMVLGVVYGTSAMKMGHQMATLGPQGIASQSSGLAGTIAMYADVADPVFTIGWIAIAFALLVAIPGFFWELGEVVSRYTVVDVWAVLAVLLVLGGARYVENGAMDQVLAVATNRPAVEIYDRLGPDLNAALLAVNGEVQEVKLLDGGFGDVLEWVEGVDGAVGEWCRTYIWTGMVWESDDTPADQVTFEGRRPLLVAGSQAVALPMVRLMEKIDGGKALLLMRAAEVKAETAVPAELGYLQTTFFELELGTAEPDFAANVWSNAGARELMVGPTWWFGEEEGEEPSVYYKAVFDESGAEGLDAIVYERTRIKDLVNSCLPTTLSVESEDSSDLVQSGKFCRLHPMPEDFDAEVDNSVWDVWRLAAAEVTDMPEPEHFVLEIEANDLMSEWLDTPVVLDRMRRELDAIHWCFNMLRDEGELIEGEMDLIITLSKKGRTSTAIHEDSELQDSTFSRCASKRWGKIEFEIPEEPELTDEEKEELKEMKEEERKKWERRGKPVPVPEIAVHFELETPPEFQDEEE